MKSTEKITVEFTNDNRNLVRVIGAETMDQAVTAADEFLAEFDMCVKNGGSLYGSSAEAEAVELFNVG
jgi:hypothetical protein